MGPKVLLRCALGCALLALTMLALPAAGEAAGSNYASPGYRWDGKLPKVAPTVPAPVIHLGDGIDPHLLVDAAGTGQIAYAVAPSIGQSAVRDCVLKRGQTGCTANASLLPPATDPEYSIDDDGPTPLALGNQLLMLDHRYPDELTLPDGSTGSGTFLWTSDDAGGTFTGPGIVGNLPVSGNAIVFGGANPSIGWITDTQTGGTFFQSAAAGAYQGAQLNLGDQGPDEAYNGRLALDGTRPVAEFSDLSNHIYVREWNGTGDITQSSSWSVARIDGTGYSRIVGGPAGVFLLYAKVGSEDLVVQRVVNGQPAGAPSTVVTGDDYDHANYAITEDASGGLTVGWFDSSSAGNLVTRTSTDGARSWGDPQTIARHLNAPSDLQLGAAQDGGGFAAFTTPETGGVSHAQVDVAAFGTFSATGLPGLGNLDGDGAGGLGGDPLGSSSCTDVHFGDIDAIAQAGCFLRDPSDPTSGAAVSTGEIRLNGLQIIPDAGVKIVIDPKLHTINTTGSVSVVLRAPGIGDITLFHGELHVNLAGSLADAGQTLFDFDVSKATSSLEGFPFNGSIDVQIQHDSVLIPASLTLPPYMGGITASATLLANDATGFELRSLHIGVADLPLGALEIKKLAIDYDGDGNVWKGMAHLDIPAGTPDFGIQADVEFDDGDFTMGSFHVDVPFPGIPVFEDAYLTGFGGSFDIHPGHKEFGGSIDFGAIPLDPPNFAIGLDGNVSITFPDTGPVVVKMTGTGTVHGSQVASAQATFESSGYFALTGNVDLDLTVLDLQASLNAFADLPAGTFASEVKGSLEIAGISISDVDGIISSKGAGACGGYFGLRAGFGYTWSGSPQIFWHGCDFGPYRVQPSSAVASSLGAAARPSFVANVGVASGTAVSNLEVDGTGGAPTVTLTDPAGQTITPPPLTPQTAGASSFQVADPAHDVTYVTVVGPHAGNWTVAAAPGSAPVARVLAARGYPEPKLSASVSGRGRARTLHYAVSGPPGLAVQFAEQGASTWRVLGSAHGPHGTLPFTPAIGPAGTREVVALVSENGMPLRRQVLTHYRAPGPPRPGAVSGLRVARHGRAFRIAFGRASGAARYTVHAIATDGHRSTWVISRGPHRRTVPAIGYADRLDVTVAGISSLDETGPAARASASYASPVYRRAHRTHTLHRRHRRR
jgi:hypothetical protein